MATSGGKTFILLFKSKLPRTNDSPPPPQKVEKQTYNVVAEMLYLLLPSEIMHHVHSRSKVTPTQF